MTRFKLDCLGSGQFHAKNPLLLLRVGRIFRFVLVADGLAYRIVTVEPFANGLDLDC